MIKKQPIIPTGYSVMVRLFSLEGIDEFRISGVRRFFRLIYRPPFRIQPLGLIFNVFRFLRRLGFSRSGSMCLVGLEGSVGSLSFSSLSLGICMGTGQSCSFSSYSHLPAYRWSWDVLELWRACLRSINLLLKKIWGDALMIVTIIFLCSLLSVLSISTL